MPTLPYQSELELLHAVACAERSRARAGLEQLKDWAPLLALAQRHRLTPLLADLTLEHTQGLVPVDAEDALRSAARAAALRASQLDATLTSCTSALLDAGMSCLPLKGPDLAKRLYRNEALRPADDVDILVARSRITDARRVILALGFEEHDPIPERRVAAAAAIGRGFVFRHWQHGVMVDLMSRPLDHPICAPPFERALEERLDWDAERPQVLALPGEFELLFLVLHGTKHLWSRLIWVADLVRARTQYGEGIWAGARKHASRCGLLGAFQTAEAIMAQPFTEEPHDTAPMYQAILAGWADPPAALTRHHLRVLDTRRARLRYLWDLATTPGRADWTDSRVPVGLSRPLRLLRRGRRDSA